MNDDFKRRRVLVFAIMCCFLLCVFMVWGNAYNEPCLKKEDSVTLTNKANLQEQITRTDTRYIVKQEFNLKEKYSCKLTKQIKIKGKSCYRNDFPIKLVESQTLWIPSGCFVLDADSGLVVGEGERLIPAKEMSIYIVGEHALEVDYFIAGILTVPEGCTLVFQKGCFKDGVLFGNGTFLAYKQPFLNNTYLIGTWRAEGIVKDDEIFIDKDYTWSRVHSCLSIASSSGKTVFSNNTYRNMETLELVRSANIDFGGSIFYMSLDQAGLPLSFLTTTPSSDRSVSTNRFTNIAISNVSIIGNPSYAYNGTAVPGFSGKYRRAIQLFKASDVMLENISLSHYVVGTNNAPEGLPPAGVNRYINSAIVVWGYDHCFIDNVRIHDCHADNLIKLVPNINAQNHAVVRNCHAYKNFTGLLALYDGRIECYDNTVEDYDSSAMNLFCYDSEIHNNKFLNSRRSVAIDISEDGAYQADGVSISNNIVESSVGGLADICGNNIKVLDNIVTGNGEGVTAFYLSIPQNNTFELGETTNNPFTREYLTAIRISGNEAKGYPMFLRCIQSSNTISSKSDIMYEQVLIDNNTFEGIDILKSYGGLIYLPPVKRISINDNIFSGSNLAIGTSGWGSVITIQSGLSNDYFFPEVWLELKNNKINSSVINQKKDVLVRIHSAKTNKPKGHFRVKVDAEGNVGENRYDSIISVNGNLTDFEVIVEERDNVNIPVKSAERIKIQKKK